MRKVVSVLLSAAMALSLCAGCSSSSSDTADTKAAEEKGADAADTEAGEAAEGVMPAVAKEDLKVGVIHIGNPADGSGYSYTHDQGIVAMQKAVGLEDDQITDGGGEEQRAEHTEGDVFAALHRKLRRVDIGFCHGRYLSFFSVSPFYHAWQEKARSSYSSVGTMEQPSVMP